MSDDESVRVRNFTDNAGVRSGHTAATTADSGASKRVR